MQALAWRNKENHKDLRPSCLEVPAGSFKKHLGWAKAVWEAYSKQGVAVTPKL